LFSSSTWSPKYPDEIVKPAVFKAIRLCVESDAANPESPTPLAVWFSLISGGARHLEGEHSSPARRFPEIVPVVVEHILAQHQDHPIDEMMCLMHMCIRALHGPAAKLVAEHLVGRLPEWGFGQLLREISYTEEGGALSIGYLCEELNARMRESKLFCESVEGVPVDVADTRVLHARVFREALKRATTPGDFHALLKALDDSLPNNKKRLRTMRRQVLKKLLVVGLVGCEIDDGLAIMREAAVFRDLKTSVFQLLKELPWANGPESQLRQRVLEAEDPLSDFRQPTHRLERMVWEEILAEAHPLAWWLELVRINRWYLTRDLQTRLWGKVEGCAQSDDEKSALLTLLEKPYGKNGRKGRNPSHGSFAKSRQEEALRLRLRVWRAGRFAAVQECVAEMNTRDYSSPIYTAAKQRLDMLLEVTASAATLV
jgi:hypothetical protein